MVVVLGIRFLESFNINKITFNPNQIQYKQIFWLTQQTKQINQLGK